MVTHFRPYYNPGTFFLLKFANGLKCHKNAIIKVPVCCVIDGPHKSVLP